MTHVCKCVCNIDEIMKANNNQAIAHAVVQIFSTISSSAVIKKPLQDNYSFVHQHCSSLHFIRLSSSLLAKLYCTTCCPTILAGPAATHAAVGARLFVCLLQASCLCFASLTCCFAALAGAHLRQLLLPQRPLAAATASQAQCHVASSSNIISQAHHSTHCWWLTRQSY